MPHEDQFTAVGPSLTGSGFPRAGFPTKASDTVHGVNVRGEKCGVYGESDVPLRSAREPEIDGVGVHGFGTKFGVSGRATANGIAGIIGRHGNNGIGVIGAVKSEDLKGIGVVGVSRSPGLGSPTAPVPDPADGLGIEGCLALAEKGRACGEAARAVRVDNSNRSQVLERPGQVIRAPESPVEAGRALD